MSNYPRSPILLKGALIEFSERFISVVPNIIIFQYNPETMTRTLEPWAGITEESKDTDSAHKPPATAQPNDPTESFSLALELDAADALEKPESHPVALISGVADRISALELLMYPQGESLLGGLLGSVAGTLSMSTDGAGIKIGGGASTPKPVPRSAVPVVLFAWGPGRILPVRITSFSVEEQAYSPLLYPIRAKVNIGLKVVHTEELEKLNKKYKLSKEIAIFANKWTYKQKEVLALANIANTVESSLGMLPI